MPPINKHDSIFINFKGLASTKFMVTALGVSLHGGFPSTQAPCTIVSAGVLKVSLL